MWTSEILIATAAVGALAGFLAGLFGVGGGTLVVPAVLWLLEKQGAGGAYGQHLAVGTSFAVMVFTTFSGALAQHRRRAVRWDVVLRMSPAMIAGGAAGALVSRWLPMRFLQWFFMLMVTAVAVQLLLRLKPKPGRELPGRAGLAGVGGAIGVVSSWVGIGGGSLSVPFLVYCNVPVHQAVGTSGGLAWTIAVSGAAGYLLAGLGTPGLPPYSLGFWYLPAAAALAVCTTLFAPLGVRTAHRLPPEKLKTALGLLMLAIAAQMAWKMFRAAG